MKRVLTLRNLGNLLICLSLLFFAAMAYPLVKLYLSPPTIPSEKTYSDTFTITIPKIHAHAPVVENVDPWDERTYREALKHGVAQAKYTGLPGEKRTVYLFAHSSGPPWEQLYYNTVFLRLGELQNGDKVELERKKKRYVYVVYDKKEIWPTEVNYLKNTKKDQLILQTCTPIGTSLKRLLIFAKPIQTT